MSQRVYEFRTTKYEYRFPDGLDKAELQKAAEQNGADDSTVIESRYEFPDLPPPPPNGGVLSLIAGEAPMRKPPPKIVLEVKPARAHFRGASVELGNNFLEINRSDKPFPYDPDKSNVDGLWDGAMTALLALSEKGCQINDAQLLNVLVSLREKEAKINEENEK